MLSRVRWIVRGDVDISSNNVTGRYIRRTRDDANLTSNTQFGSTFAADQLTTDHNLALGMTRVFGSNVLNEARFAFIKRDLAFPENDPDSPTAVIGGLFTIGGANAFPQGRVQSTYQFQDVATIQRGSHSLKLGADIRYVDLDNIAAFDTKGTFTFNNLQDYMNNFAVTFVQAPQDYRDAELPRIRQSFYWEYAQFFAVGMRLREHRTGATRGRNRSICRSIVCQQGPA